jgi:hypothetical protein
MRKLVCAYGCEYSADPADYFLAGDENSPIGLCEHDGEELTCDLVESQHIQGVNDHGQEYYGQVWVVLAHDATLADLKRREFTGSKPAEWREKLAQQCQDVYDSAHASQQRATSGDRAREHGDIMECESAMMRTLRSHLSDNDAYWALQNLYAQQSNGRCRELIQAVMSRFAV